jgi:hypothetical protein
MATRDGRRRPSRRARVLARTATRLAGDAKALAAELRAANGRREDEVPVCYHRRRMRPMR